MRVYLTGGSGLLGSHLAERLRARGDEVLCLQRKGSDTHFLESRGCRMVEGDVREGADSLRAGMVGCDVVVHAAALVYVGCPWPRLRAVNVEGTQQVVKAAAAAGVPRVLHVSSVAVYGRDRSSVDEAAPMDAALEPTELYARSKREAEAAARGVADAAGIKLSIIRPAALYGERDRLLAPKLANLLRLPVIPLLGSGNNTLAVVYAGNAAHALERILDSDEAGRIFNLGVDRPLTQRDLLDGMARALGRKARFVSIPEYCVRQVASLGELLKITLPGAGDLTLERIARLSLEDNPYVTHRLRAELGWSPPFTHEQGLERTAAWLKEVSLA